MTSGAVRVSLGFRLRPTGKCFQQSWLAALVLVSGTDKRGGMDLAIVVVLASALSGECRTKAWKEVKGRPCYDWLAEYRGVETPRSTLISLGFLSNSSLIKFLQKRRSWILGDISKLSRNVRTLQKAKRNEKM